MNSSGIISTRIVPSFSGVPSLGTFASRGIALHASIGQRWQGDGSNPATPSGWRSAPARLTSA
jgi:hypothetical protein